MKLIKENDKWLFHPTDELRKLIVENPDLPVVVMATEDAYCDDFNGGMTICSRVTCSIEDVLSPSSLTDDRIFVGKDEFEDWIRDNPSFQGVHSEDSEEEFDAAVKEQVALVDDDWIAAIVVVVGN